MLVPEVLKQLILAKLIATGHFVPVNSTDKGIPVDMITHLAEAIAYAVCEHIWTNLEVIIPGGFHTHNITGDAAIVPTPVEGFHIHPPATIK